MSVEKSHYTSPEDVTKEIALSSDLINDLYIVLDRIDYNNRTILGDLNKTYPNYNLLDKVGIDEWSPQEGMAEYECEYPCSSESVQGRATSPPEIILGVLNT